MMTMVENTPGRLFLTYTETCPRLSTVNFTGKLALTPAAPEVPD